MDNIQEIRDPDSGKLLKKFCTSDGIINGAMLIFDDNEQVAYKLHFVEGTLSGPAEFYQNQQLLMQTNFANGKQHGDATIYIDGIKSSTLHYIYGQLDGDFCSFDAKGNLIRKATYSAGQLNGNCELYYPDGTLMEHCIYKHNKLNGDVHKYYPSGSIREISSYKDGVPVGYIDSYDVNGNLVSSIEA